MYFVRPELLRMGSLRGPSSMTQLTWRQAQRRDGEWSEQQHKGLEEHDGWHLMQTGGLGIKAGNGCNKIAVPGLNFR